MTPRSITSTRTMTPNRIVLALVAAGMLGGAGATFVAGSRAHAAAPAAMAVAPPGNGAVAAPDFAQIAQRYGPTVVNISVSGMKKTSNDQGRVPGHNEIVETDGLGALHVVRALGARPAIDLQLRGPELGRPGRLLRPREIVDFAELRVGARLAAEEEIDERPGQGGEGAGGGMGRRGS